MPEYKDKILVNDTIDALKNFNVNAISADEDDDDDSSSWIDKVIDKVKDFFDDDEVKEFIDDKVKELVEDTTDLVKSGLNYIYEGGTKIIKNYMQGEQINLASDFLGLGLDEKNFFINSSSGTLSIENVRDKLIQYGDAVGNLIAYSYMASHGGEVNGKDFAKFAVLIGADDLANQLIAGSGGSSLWGGNGGDDTLIGGDGYDEFFYTVGNGNDVIQNAASNDIVNLLGVALEQITDLKVNDVAVEIGFNNGGKLRVEGNTGAGFLLGGVTYTVNQSTGVWSTR